MLTRVMCYATTVCSTRVVRVGLCIRSFGMGFLPMYESREVSTEVGLGDLSPVSFLFRPPWVGLFLRIC